jgi:drug/metabolite transporter (DMT)-like permease
MSERFMNYLPQGQIILACLIWGSYGLIVQGVDQPAQIIVFFRFLFGFLTLLILLSRTKEWRKLFFPEQRKVLITAGIVNTISWLLLTKAIQLTSVANGFILYYTAPYFIVLLAPIVLKEKIKRKSFFALGFCFLGIISVVGFGQWHLTTIQLWGNIMGMGSGIAYACYIILLKKLAPHLLGLVSNTYVCGVIAFLTFPMALPYFQNVSLYDVRILAFAGIMIQGVAATLYMIALRKVTAQQASILSYLEVLFASLLAAVFLKEGFTLDLIVGGLLVVLGGIIVVIEPEHKGMLPKRGK